MPTKSQLAELKDTLVGMKEELTVDQERYNTANESLTETVDELSSYDNHPADLGTELYEREREQALDSHAASEIEKIEEALKAMEDGLYGFCKVCGTEIPFERLEIIPYTLYCVEHKPIRDEQVQTEYIERPASDDLEMNKSPHITDGQDSFKDVARYGTSETPADFINVPKDYNDLYKDQERNGGFTEDIDTFTATGIEGRNKRIYPNEKEKEYKEGLDAEGMESPLGDIPYKRGDSYIKDKRNKD